MTLLANPDDRFALLELDRRFFDALVAADAADLGALLAEDFVLVSIADGATVNGSELIGAVSAGAVRFQSIGSFPDEAVVRRIGNVGIVVGRTEMAVAKGDGTLIAGSRYTHVFVADPDAGWRLVSAQGTEIKSTL